jgi:hypothetical protein
MDYALKFMRVELVGWRTGRALSILVIKFGAPKSFI